MVERGGFHSAWARNLLDGFSGWSVPGPSDIGGELPFSEIPVIPAFCLPSGQRLSRLCAPIHRCGYSYHPRKHIAGGDIQESGGTYHTISARSSVFGECGLSLEPFRL